MIHRHVTAAVLTKTYVDAQLLTKKHRDDKLKIATIPKWAANHLAEIAVDYERQSEYLAEIMVKPLSEKYHVMCGRIPLGDMDP